jgi:hypothetical protein
MGLEIGLVRLYQIRRNRIGLGPSVGCLMT